MALLKKLLLRSIKTVWVLFATAVLVLAVIISLLKVLLPYADNYKNDIEAYLYTNFNANVTIGSIGASWQQLGPAIVLNEVSLSATEDAPLDITIMETKVSIDFWRSLQEQRLVTGTFQLNGINTYINSDVFFKVRPQSQGSQLFEGLSHLFLAQIQQFQVTDSTIIVRHQSGQNQTFQIDYLSWLNEGNRHRGQGDVYIDGFSDNSLSIRMDLYGQRRSEIFGMIYLEAQQVDITPWLTQFIGEHISVTSTEGNFQLWGDVSDGLVKQILVDVKNTGVRWQKQKQPKKLFINEATLKWQQLKSDWALVANEIKLKTEQQEPEPFDLNLLRKKNQTELIANNVDLNTITQLFSLFSATKETSLLADTNVNGDVRSLHIAWPDDAPMMASIDVKDFSFLPESSPNSAYLGLNDLDLKGAWKGNVGRFSLTGAFGQLETKDTFAKPFSYETLEMVTDIRVLDTGVEVWLPKIKLVNDDILIRATAEFLLFDESHLKVYAEVEGPKTGQIPNYLPKYLIGKDTHDYLIRSIQAGRGKLTQVVIDGDPADIPFSDANSTGTFIVRAELADTLFEFDEEWPALVDLNAILTVDKMDMFIDAKDGEIGPLTVNNNVHAKIDLAAQSTVLELDINPNNLAFSKFHTLVKTTPLAEILGDVFDFVQLDGSGDAKVHLSIPLSDTPNELGVIPEFVAKGNVITKDAGLALPSINLDIKNLTSVVSFENDAFSISDASGLWFDLPIAFNVTGSDGNGGYKIDGQVDATWEHQQLATQINGPIANYFDGELNSSLALAVNIEEGDDYQYFVDANVDLSNASYRLTGPLNKSNGEPATINISVLGDANSNDVYIDLANDLKFMGVIPATSGRMEQAILAIGEHDQVASLLLPESGFNIDIKLPNIEFDPTLSFVMDLLDSLPSGGEESGSFMDAPQSIKGQFDNVSIFGQQWQNIALTAQPNNDDWLFHAVGKDVDAKVFVPNQIDVDGLTINADYLHIKNVPVEGEKVSTPTVNSKKLINGIPALNVVCQKCTYNDKPLGKISLNTFTRDGSLFIERAEMEYERNKVSLTGIWAGNEGPGKTTVTGDIYSRYLGPWMLDWDFNSGIKQSDLKSKLALSWNGAPQDFEFSSLNGELSFELGEGYLSEISDKGARIFSLFSLNSLYRKLKFDFNDVFQKGLFYNDIKGSLLVESGVVYTEDIRMDGVAGNMNMRGFTNLNQSILDYDVTFKPKISSSIPVIAAWLAPGSAGLSLLAGIAIDKIIEKADVVSEVRLKVTGNLSDPQVQEVKRFTKTISIPRPPQRPITPIDPNEQPAEKSDNKSTEQSKSQSEAKPETNTDKKSGQGQ
ncbi:YhdP family protein [Psychrosphaera aestuarii]|uniref:YhdP family protein n=1 Tax=Psychrosphaera aestuarii TaxID=1266052 RepID=UPI001B33566F|nr:YhdP family protein [Psychrosphaera aestuarii]